MTLLLVLSSAPYQGSDAAWNTLRLADSCLEAGMAVRLFLINDGVDAARRPEGPPPEFDLSQMVEELVGRGVDVRLCGTCIQRCGISKGDLAAGVQVAGMKDLADWIQSSDRALSF